MQEIYCIVSGRVQMVMYRDFAQRKARSLRISGYVKNLPDGSVEVVAQGEREALEQFIAKLWEGPFFSRVEDVHVEWRESTETYQSFRTVY